MASKDNSCTRVTAAATDEPAHTIGDDERPIVFPLRDVERKHISHVLEVFKWNKRQAARALRISRDTLYRKISEYALESLHDERLGGRNARHPARAPIAGQPSPSSATVIAGNR